MAVRAGTILPHLEDYAEAAAQTSAPRNAGLVTGASGTTDIEGSYVRGAHGPRFLHVVVVLGGRVPCDIAMSGIAPTLFSCPPTLSNVAQ